MLQRFYLFTITSVMLLWCSTVVQATEKGLFWQLQSPAGKISYLFGTIHTDDNRVTDFSESIQHALKSADVFAMETPPNSDPAHFVMAKGTLKTELSAAELDTFRDLVDFHVLHLDYALTMKPWLLAVVFSQYKPQTPYAQDNLLMRSAEDFGKAVVGLETHGEHFGIMDDFTMGEQMLMLRAAMQLTEAEKARDFERLIAVYQAGDGEKLLMLNAEMMRAGLPEALSQKMLMKLLDTRNQLMATRAIALANTQSAFIAVGAAHLAGETGLIQQFKQAGYTVTRLHQ